MHTLLRLALLASLLPSPAWAEDGFIVATADGASRLKVGGYLQIDYRWFVGDDEKLNVDQFVLRRVRPDLQGVLWNHFEFRLLPDFASSRLVLQDAYIDVNYHPALRVRAGKFKPPVGLERLQSATAIDFVERALPTNLVPNRDLGLQLWGELAWLTWAAGVFNGVPDGGVGEGDVSDDKEVAARLFLTPGVPGRLGVGGAFTFGKKRGTLAAPDVGTYKATGQATIFAPTAGATLDATTVAAGDQVRATGQAFYYLGPLGLLGEFVFSSQEVARGATTGKIEASAFQAQVSFVLTGGDASFGGVKPTAPLDPGEGTWGAFEIAARFHQLRVQDAAFADGFADPARSVRKATAVGGGARWYLNRNLKLVVDFEHTDFSGGAAAGDRPVENVVLSRFATVF